MAEKAELLRKEILEKVKTYFTEQLSGNGFTPGKDPVRYAGRVFDEQELINLVDASLDFWLTEGRYAESFARKLSDFLGVKHVVLTNSGSSANLLAFAALTSEKLGTRRLKAGDEVITVAAGFPSTVAPILQYGLIPVFVDVKIPTYNIDIEMLRNAITDKTRCIFLAHTLGNPFDLDAVTELAERYNLWVIEDNCDALGSRYHNQYTGTFGHLATLSFYPAHHITTGEGGAVVTQDSQLAELVRSFRDWGRDCYCNGGKNNSCGKRFSGKFGSLPEGYDHKYVYSEVGYNLKMTDLQAAIGAAQMEKLSGFCQQRKANFENHASVFSRYPQFFILPKATGHSDPAWFSFIVTLTPEAPFTREELTLFLNNRKIETRNLFGGNLCRQPAFQSRPWRIAAHLNNTDLIMNRSFFLGTYPGLTEAMFDYEEQVLRAFMERTE